MNGCRKKRGLASVILSLAIPLAAIPMHGVAAAPSNDARPSTAESTAAPTAATSRFEMHTATIVAGSARLQSNRFSLQGGLGVPSATLSSTRYRIDDAGLVARQVTSESSAVITTNSSKGSL